VQGKVGFPVVVVIKIKSGHEKLTQKGARWLNVRKENEKIAKVNAI